MELALRRRMADGSYDRKEPHRESVLRRPRRQRARGRLHYTLERAEVIAYRARAPGVGQAVLEYPAAPSPRLSTAVPRLALVPCLIPALALSACGSGGRSAAATRAGNAGLDAHDTGIVLGLRNRSAQLIRDEDALSAGQSGGVRAAVNTCSEARRVEFDLFVGTIADANAIHALGDRWWQILARPAAQEPHHPLLRKWSRLLGQYAELRRKEIAHYVPPGPAKICRLWRPWPAEVSAEVNSSRHPVAALVLLKKLGYAVSPQLGAAGRALFDKVASLNKAIVPLFRSAGLPPTQAAALARWAQIPS